MMMTKAIRQIKRERESQDISMRDLAKKANVSRTYLYRVFSGEQVPAVDIADRLAKALGKSLELK